MRTPVFELHIRPLIRLIDREGMLWAFDLFDYDQLVQHAEQIADRSAVDMPPLTKGGPWPQEFVDIFRRWMVTGFKRLELGVGTYSWSATSTSATVNAKGTFPKPGYKGWLHLEEETVNSRTYLLYFEAPDEPQAGNASPFVFKDKYTGPADTQIFIRDLNGIHQIH